jgi:phytol kinase
MISLLLAVATVFVLLLINELWWRNHDVRTEFGRKFVHVTVGSFVAFWPFFLSWHQIEGLSVAFLVVVIASKYLRLFQAIHSVQRPTWGELFFAVAVGSVALVTHDKWIYAAALMQMALADGLAAIVGVQYGNRVKYLVFKHPKSVIGTFAFFLVSLAILLSYSSWSGRSLTIAYIMVVSLAATALENVAVWGLDNLLVPLLVAVLLVNR